MKIWFSWQIGLMITFGVNFQKRAYITIEIPFVMIQIFLFKYNKK